MTGFVIGFSDALDRLTRLFMQAALALIVVLFLAEVVARNVFGNSLTWVEELSVTFLGTWFVFIGAAHAKKIGMLISFEFLIQRLGRRSAAAVFVVTELLALVFLGVIIAYGMRLSFANMMQPSPALRLPMGAAYLGIVVGCAIMAIHGVAAILQRATRRSAA